VFSALEVCYDNALYKFTFDIDIDIHIVVAVVVARCVLMLLSTGPLCSIVGALVSTCQFSAP